MTNGILAVITIIIIAIIGVFMVVIPFVTQDTVTLTVTGKDTYTSTDCSSDSDGHTSCHTYLHNLVYTNGEILSFSDNIILWVWGSQSSFSHITVGKTYRFDVYGISIPALNWYRTVKSYGQV